MSPTGNLRGILPGSIMVVAVAVAGFLSLRAELPDPVAPNLSTPSGDAFVFGVVGDTGTGYPSEWAVAREMAALRRKIPFDQVIMLGDNIYATHCGSDPFRKCFEKPFGVLLDKGMTFHAVLGNHGSLEEELTYEPFNMKGRSYYSFAAKANLVEFFALDSAQMDVEQLAWLETALASSHAAWKIPFFHKPLYNAGSEHRPDVKLRTKLEPLFTRYNVRAAMSGHEHVYERMKPQQGIVYFVAGSGGHVKPGVNRSDPVLAVADDTHHCFMLFAATPDELRYWAITNEGQVVDTGSILASSL